MVWHDPYAQLAELRDFPAFEVTSETLVEGEPQPLVHRSLNLGGSDLSPQLSWSGFPAETKSFAVTQYDPDAPTGSGFWHWALYNIPASVTSLAAGVGAAHAETPAGSVTLKNELRLRQYSGAEPPAGTGTHRYFTVVHAVDVDRLDIDPESTPAVLGFNLHFHTIARAILLTTAAADDGVNQA